MPEKIRSKRMREAIDSRYSLVLDYFGSPCFNNGNTVSLITIRSMVRCSLAGYPTPLHGFHVGLYSIGFSSGCQSRGKRQEAGRGRQKLLAPLPSSLPRGLPVGRGEPFEKFAKIKRCNIGFYPHFIRYLILLPHPDVLSECLTDFLSRPLAALHESKSSPHDLTQPRRFEPLFAALGGQVFQLCIRPVRADKPWTPSFLWCGASPLRGATF